MWWIIIIAAILIPPACYALGRTVTREDRVFLPQLLMLAGGGWMLLGASQPVRLYRQLFVTSADIFLEQLPVMRRAMVAGHLWSRVVGPIYFTVAVVLPFSLGSGGLPAMLPVLSLGLLLVPAVLLAEMLSIVLAARLAVRQLALQAARLVRLATLSALLFALPIAAAWLIFPSGKLTIPVLDPGLLERVVLISSVSPLWLVCFLALVLSVLTVSTVGLPRLLISFHSPADPSPKARRLPVFLVWLIRSRRADRPFLTKDSLHLSRSDYLAVGSIASRMLLVAAPVLGGLFAARQFSAIPQAIIVGVACLVLYFLKDLFLDCVLMPVLAIENDLAAVHLFWRRDFTLWQILREKWTLLNAATWALFPLDVALMVLFCGSLLQALILGVLLLAASQLSQLVSLAVSTVFFQSGCERVAEAGHSQKAETVGVVCAAPLMAAFGGMLWFLLGRSADSLLLQFAALVAFVSIVGSVGLLIVRYLSVKRLSEIDVY